MNFTGWFVIIGIIAFVIYCFLAEANCSAKHSPTIVTILCRLVARHIKLACKLFVGLLYFIVGMGCILKMNTLMIEQKKASDAGRGGAQTEQLAGFINRVTLPVQMAVDGLIGTLGLIALGIGFGIFGLAHSAHQHPLPYIAAAVAVYLLWLVLNIHEVVEEEVISDWTWTESENPGDPRPVPHRILTKKDHATWSLLTAVLWIVITGISIVWLSTRITHTPASPTPDRDAQGQSAA